MGIAELKALVGDNQEMAAEIVAIEQTLTKNTGRIMDLETMNQKTVDDMNKAIASRDKVKDVIRSELGIEEFTVDAVRGKLENYASDDAIAAREKQYNELKANSANKIEILEGTLRDRDGAINSMNLKLAISKTDVMGQTKGEYANEMLMGWISEDATFDENGDIQYKGSAGETLYNENGNPLTLDDRINAIKGDPARDFVFQASALQGGGAPTEKVINGPAGSTSGGSYTRTTMSPDEKHAYIDKYSIEAYNRLPML